MSGNNQRQHDFGPRAGQAHVQGPADVGLLNLTLPAQLKATVARHGPRTAAVFSSRGVRWSWDQFSANVDDLAAGLLKLGLVRGDRVGMWGPNTPEWLLTQFATARAGLILVAINPAYRLHELKYALNKVECRALVLSKVFKTSNYIEMIETLAPELRRRNGRSRLKSHELPFLEFVIEIGNDATEGALPFDAVLADGVAAGHQGLDALTASLDPRDPINIQFTSGTTGAPKAATLTHRNLVNNGNAVAGRLHFSAQDCLCIPVPLYHCFGMVMGVIGSVTHGATMVFPGEGFDPLTTLSSLAAERCTAVYGVPTMFIAMLEHPDFQNFDIGSLRTGIMAGAPCPIELMKRVITRMNLTEITIAYGMTETSPVSFQSFVDDPLERRVSTVGRIHPHLEAKIVAADGSTVPAGVAGEICTRGYSVMRGYWGDEDATQQAIRDGWMHTGDIGVIDEEGYLSIAGRIKDMVIRGGENIYPREIEEFLLTHPKIRDAQVFGVPDDKYGEELCAYLICRDGCEADDNEIRAFCTGAIAYYKIPKYIRFKREYPLTATGKVQKFVMREELQRELLGEGN